MLFAGWVVVLWRSWLSFVVGRRTPGARMRYEKEQVASLSFHHYGAFRLRLRFRRPGVFLVWLEGHLAGLFARPHPVAPRLARALWVGWQHHRRFHYSPLADAVVQEGL